MAALITTPNLPGPDDFYAGQGPDRVAEILAAAPGVAEFFRAATRATG